MTQDLAAKQPTLSTLPRTGTDLLHMESQLRRIFGSKGIAIGASIDVSNPESEENGQIRVLGEKLQAAIAAKASTADLAALDGRLSSALADCITCSICLQGLPALGTWGAG